MPPPTVDPVRYQACTEHNIGTLPQLARLGSDERFAIDVVSTVLPFKTNNYVVDQLIDWDAAPDDPLYTLTFPRMGMLQSDDFAEIASLHRNEVPPVELRAAADRIRLTLNPHPAGQLEHNVPEFEGERLGGMQHKYRETVLFFPSQGQTCHAYCTFCFRWPQFIGVDELHFGMRESETLIAYLRQHPEVSDVLITGGDPLVMRSHLLARYLEPLIEARLPNLTSIRIGTKALSFWPHRFLTDEDADDLLALFRRITGAGLHLAIMAHFNHPRELEPEPARLAIERLQDARAQLRTQSPLLRHINEAPEVWSRLWREQVRLGMVPYYMFVARDTGAQHYFELPLVRACDTHVERQQPPTLRVHDHRV
jgi:L-lysine 2,3-aminomutase